MMRAEIKSPVLAGDGADERKQTSGATLAHGQTKIKRILAELANGRSLNRFEAERLGDHCLNSTIAKIEARGIQVARRDEAVPGFGGHVARVCRYRLDDENRERAKKFLGGQNGEGRRNPPP